MTGVQTCALPIYDANLAVQAANLAEQNGLNIQSIGQFFIDSNGKNWTNVPFPNLKDFISNNMKINATKGDTIIVMTIGHGAKGGYLMDIGQRKDLLNTIAQAAQENNQETLWWQLSCYASSNLPNINQLSSQQQKLISIVASSDENTESPAYVEGNIMKELFLIMANKPNDIDLDDNSIVSANELALTLNKIKPNRGKLVYAISPNEPVFGLGLAKLLKIIDHNTKQISNDPEFIQLPPLNQPIPKF